LAYERFFSLKECRVNNPSHYSGFGTRNMFIYKCSICSILNEAGPQSICQSDESSISLSFKTHL